MRYSHLKTKPLKSVSFECFDGGLNTREGDDLILDNQLSDGANLLFENGTLTSRKGLSFNLEDVIGGYDNYGHFHKGLKVTDTEISINNTIYRVAYALWGDYSSYQTLYVYFISPDNKLTPAGNFQFKRTSQDIYYTFSNIVFLVGSKNKGCGLYAFLTLKSGDDRRCEIYELNSSYSEWLKVEEKDFYAPIVQLNGKGNRYQDAVREDKFSIPDVTKPEKYNMLTPRFRAYFTTDGHSDTFQLPIKKISMDSTVLCRVYVSQNHYNEWVIPEGEAVATVLTDNGYMTMRCYRNSATIVFFDEENNVTSLPKSYLVSSNNLLVEASRETEETASQIIGCKHCRVYNSNIFFYGNEQKNSNLYVTTTGNPLYFPENMKCSVGNPSDSITAMAVQNNKLIAFKSNEIYQVSIDKNESELLSDGLAGSNTAIFENKQVRLTLIHGSIGCANKDTLAVCGNRLVWLGHDANVYTLATTTYGKENNVYCVSEPISNILKAYSKDDILSSFAFDTGGYYVLYIAKSLYLLNYRIKNFGISPVYTALGKHSDSIAWFVMKLPHQKYYSGYSSNGEIYLACGDSDLKYLSLATLSGETDMVLKLENGVAAQTEFQIESSITTKFFKLSEPYKRKIIEEVSIGMDFSDIADIILNDGNIEYKQTVFSPHKNLAPIKIAPHFKGVYGVSVTLASKSPINFKGITVKYKDLI